MIKGRFINIFSVFFISVSLFVYQIVLTRIYSTLFSYHYVFLITSFAILGLGIGSIYAYKTRAGLNNQENIKDEIINGSILLTLSYISIFAVNYLIPFANSMWVYVSLGIIPFFIGGYLLSSIFRAFSGISGKLYFADLVGSGIGRMTVISLLNNTGILRTTILICLIALVPALILSSDKLKKRSFGCILAAFLITGLLVPGHYVKTIEKNFSGMLTNENKIFGNLQQSGKPPEIVYSKWNAFSRTDVIKLPQVSDKLILSIDGEAGSYMFEFDGKMKSLETFKKDTGFLPYSFGNNNNTLVIGPGGGRDVLYALAGGSRDITAVEINTSSIDAVKAYGKYNGNIYNRPEVKVYGEDGRSFVRQSEEKYDSIFLSLVMTSTTQGMGYALSENYIYTVEALNDYLDHLNNNGKITFLVHDEDEILKLVATAIRTLGEKGIGVKDAVDQIAIFTKIRSHEHEGDKKSLLNPVVIIKNEPFKPDESEKLLKAALRNGSVPVYIPLVWEKGTLQQLNNGEISMPDYLDGFNLNITPATDDSPYFYNFSQSIPATLKFILVVVAFGSILVFSLFVARYRRYKPILYFNLLGAGFMMIEIPLIQKFTLYLGHPALALTYVLAALLIGGGLGGYFSNHRLFNQTVKAFYLPPVMVALINVILLLSLNYVFKTTAMLDLTGRVAIASGIVMIQGFFMGMPFPRGLKLIGESRQGELVPIMWGVNGIASVFGSVLSIVLSMSIGFTGALAAASVIYLAVGFYKTL